MARGMGSPFHVGKSIGKGPEKRKYLVFARAKKKKRSMWLEHNEQEGRVRR